MPFADYKNFKECVSKNQDKDDPEAYCAQIKRKVEKMVDNDWHYDMTFEKVGDKGGHLYLAGLAGYASNGNVDEDAQNMDMDSLKSVYKTYMENPVVKLLHDKAPQWKGAVGVVVEKFVDSAGKTWETSFGTKPFLVVRISKSPKLDWLRGMIDEGMFRGFSIGGKAKSISNSGQIIVKSWLETSIVDVPSAKGSFFQVLKSACTGDDCPITKGEMSAEDKKKEREEKLKAEKDEQGEEEKKPNQAVQKFIGAIDLALDIKSVTGVSISNIGTAMDDFLKGGPGSGQKGHTTAKQFKESADKKLADQHPFTKYLHGQPQDALDYIVKDLGKEIKKGMKGMSGLEKADLIMRHELTKVEIKGRSKSKSGGKIGKFVGFIESSDDFLKGGPGSGQKGHTTAKKEPVKHRRVKGTTGKVDKDVYEFEDRKKALRKFNSLLDMGKIVTMAKAGKKNPITGKIEKYDTVTAWD